MVWIVLCAAVLWIAFLNLKICDLKSDVAELSFRIELCRNAKGDEFRLYQSEIEVQLDEIRQHVGYEEYESDLDNDVVWQEEHRRLSSIFPRLASLEFELECHEREVKEFLLINGLKHPAEFPKADQIRILKQIIDEKRTLI